MSELLSLCWINLDRIIITGDLNLHIDVTSDWEAIDFMWLLNSLDFTQHIAGLTLNHDHTLDSRISKGLDIFVNKIVETNLSDHYCLFFEVTIVGTR